MLATVVGFGAGSVLAERRLAPEAPAPVGVLSLELVDSAAEPATGLAATADGAPALAVFVAVRNTGTEPVGLEAAEMVGSDYRTEDLAGRRVAADGSTELTLLRPVRCDRRADAAPAGPLRIRASTPAGTRTTDLQVDDLAPGAGAELAGAACGQVPPTRALHRVETGPPEIDGAGARVPFALSNASVSAVLVQSVRVPPGLRLARLLDPAGVEVALPLRLAPGDYDPPTAPELGRGPEQRLTAVLEVEDCATLRARSARAPRLPLFEATVTDSWGGRFSDDGQTGPRAAGWGDPSVLDRLREAACPVRESALAPVPPGPA